MWTFIAPLFTSFLSLSVLFYAQENTQGNSYMEQLRSKILTEDTWDLFPLYPSPEAWEQDTQNELAIDYFKICKPFREFSQLSATQLKKLFDLRFSLERRIQKLYTYAHLWFDQDTKNDNAKQALQRITLRYHKLNEAFSWIEPKILHMPIEILQTYTQSPELQSYTTILERLMRLKEHTLSEGEEAIIASSQIALSSTQKAFSAINDTDFLFHDVEDSQGTTHTLSHGSLHVLLKNPDRILRKNAFCTLHKKYLEYENTIAEMLHGAIQQHHFESKSRKYSSCLESTLYPKEIEIDVYQNLINTVRANIEPLHRYMRLRKKLLNIDALYPWDFYVPLVPESTSQYSFEEAVNLTIASCKPLGDLYINDLEKGLIKEHWVDKYENKNKHSGAYSSGCYDSFPYILMNYKGALRDVFTLAHEAGHSMHSLLSHRTQPFHYANYEIFVAEVASTFNEELLTQELLRRSQNNKEKQVYILNQKLDDICGTLFRQTLFAEFELFIHNQVEKGLPITPSLLKEKYLELNRFYYGEDVCLNDEIAIEWARIPHFYYNYYVYQYATGISAAHALVKKVTEGPKENLEAYLEFLRSGSKLFPVKLLQKAGVDMTSPEPIKATIAQFSEMLDTFEALSTQIN